MDVFGGDAKKGDALADEYWEGGDDEVFYKAIVEEGLDGDAAVDVGSFPALLVEVLEEFGGGLVRDRDFVV